MGIEICYSIAAMRCAVLADIHANMAALKAVLDDIEQKGGVDETWCLGDIVDYGPDPHPCLEMVQRLEPFCMAGNHDLAAIGRVDTAYFNPDAAIASQWTTAQLAPADIAYLRSLPLMLEREGFTLVHGSPRDPVWEYVLSAGIAAGNFDIFQSQLCLVGHTHVPLVFRLEKNGDCKAADFSPGIGLVPGDTRMIINPGGVGQPRDGDPRASYAIYESEGRVMRLYRVPYDIKSTQDRMMRAGLPIRLVTRLEQGT
jgi:diadenosine tetraphosphatase ApaH/serine/threonine PP2A family protein phosphatase